MRNLNVFLHQVSHIDRWSDPGKGDMGVERSILGDETRGLGRFFGLLVEKRQRALTLSDLGE